MALNSIIYKVNTRIFEKLIPLLFFGLSAACSSPSFTPPKLGADSSEFKIASDPESISPKFRKITNSASNAESMQPDHGSYKSAKAVAAPAKSTINTFSMRKSYDDCISAANGVVPVMQNCIGLEHKYQDDRLNAIYKNLMARLDGTKRRALRKEQHQWIVDRDKKCYYDPNNGQAGHLDAAECLLEMTTHRADNLEAR